MRTHASETFGRELEDALRTGASAGPGTTGSDAALVALAVELRDAGRPVATLVPRQQFRVELAERLREEAEQLAPARREAAARADRRPPPRAVRPATDRRWRRVATGLAAVLVVGGAGAAVASEDALPGSPLYPLKRQVEELRVQLASPGQARGDAELDLARERLEEAERLAVDGGGRLSAGREQDVRGALEDFGDSARTGISALDRDYTERGDPAALVSVDDFLDESLPLLERLRTMTPASLHPVIDALLLELGQQQVDLADAVASCGPACRDLDLDLVVAEPTPSPSAPSTRVAPGGGPVAAPTTAVPPGASSPGGLLDPLDPVVDPLPLDPVQSLVDDLLPAPNPSSTPLLPLPTVSVPPVTVPSPPVPSVSLPSVSLPSLPLPTVSVPPLLPSPTQTTCLLPVLGCD